MNNPSYQPFRSEQAKQAYLSLYDERAKNWSVPSETKTIDTTFGQTFVRISGPENGTPLILLAGAGTTSLIWNDNIEAFSKDYRTYAVDSLIHTGTVGRSVYTREIENADQATDWLNQLFDGLGLTDGINLSGISYGGWLSGEYALRYPHRTNKIVLLAPAGIVLPFGLAFTAWTMLVTFLPYRLVYERFFHWLLSDVVSHEPEFLDAFVEEYLVSSRSFVRPNFIKMVKPSPLTDEELRSIEVPTLVLMGENEVIYSPQKAMKRLETVAPHIQKEIIPHASHGLTISQKELIERKILDFLA